MSVFYSLDDLVEKNHLLSNKALNRDTYDFSDYRSVALWAVFHISNLKIPVGQSVPQTHLSLYNQSDSSSVNDKKLLFSLS